MYYHTGLVVNLPKLTLKSLAEKPWPEWLHIHTSSLDQGGQLVSLNMNKGNSFTTLPCVLILLEGRKTISLTVMLIPAS